MGIEISEFRSRDSDFKGPMDVLRRPPLAVQPSLAIGANVRSAVFGAQTHVLRLSISAACRILVYTPPEVGDATAASATGADGLSEYFPAGEHVIGVKPGQKLAAIAAA